MESISFLLPLQTQQLQMQPMSRPDVSPGTTETQQMRVTAPVGVSIASSRPPTYRLITDFFPCVQANVRLRIRISYSMSGRPVQDQVDFSGFPPGLTG